MLTLMPYLGEAETALDYYQESVDLLHPQDVGKQRVQNLVLMNELLLYPNSVTSPGALMWQGFEMALLQYQEVVCEYWDSELGGRRDIGGEDWYYRITERQYFAYIPKGEQFDEPFWLGREDIALSHQSYLIRLNPEYYGPKFPGVPEDLPIVWPVHNPIGV